MYRKNSIINCRNDLFCFEFSNVSFEKCSSMRGVFIFSSRNIGNNMKKICVLRSEFLKVAALFADVFQMNTSQGIVN
jgi:hypothetical protein